MDSVRLGIDAVEAQYLAIVLPPSTLQARLQTAQYKHPERFADEFSLLESVAELMLQRNQLQYASKLYDLSLLRVILNAEPENQRGALVERTLQMRARINDRLLGQPVEGDFVVPLPALWVHFRTVLQGLRALVGKDHCTPDLRNQFNLGLLKLLCSVWEVSVTLLGAPPCSFSVFAMGSLSRLEAAAYSDIEYGMILESDAFCDHSYGC